MIAGYGGVWKMVSKGCGDVAQNGNGKCGNEFSIEFNAFFVRDQIRRGTQNIQHTPHTQKAKLNMK